MGVYLGLPNYDEDIASLDRAPIILNSINPEANRLIDPVKEFTMTEYEGDTIDTLPTCECRRTYGRYNTSSEPGVANTVCPECHTEVMSPIDRGFTSNVWLQVPKGVSGFIRVNFLDMLIRAFNQESFNAIHWLCNTQYKPANANSMTFERFKRIGIPRGYNHFVDNFDKILDILMTCQVFKIGELQTETADLMRLKRDLVFSEYLPLPSKRSIITELSNKTRYCADGYVKIIDAARAIYGLTSKPEPSQQRVREHNTFKALVMMTEYREWLDKNILGLKSGWYRKQIYGSRTGPTYRAVVTSISGAHDYEEMHMPWGLGIATYHTHILGMMGRDGYTIEESERFILECIGRYDPYMDKLLNRLIQECPFETLQGMKGLPQLLGRNPTLNLRSIQSLFVTKFKTEIHDNTISISLLCVTSMNCDFDGDQLQGMPILSMEDFKSIRRLAPHTGINDLNRPDTINNNMAIGKPIRSTINNFLFGGWH